MRRAAVLGFTLVELMVAVLIAAIMAAIGYQALNQALKSRAAIDEQTKRFTALQQAMRTIEQDFELMQPRPVRNIIGDGYMPAVQASQTGTGLGVGSTDSTLNSGVNFTLGGVSSINGATQPLVTFTRGGWTNLVGLPRSELQRVSYAIENGALMREYTPELDATPTDPLVKQQLIDHVKSFSLRFMDAGHQWRSDWPPSSLGNGPQNFLLRARPVAVEVTIQLDDWGVLVRHIEVAG